MPRELNAVLEHPALVWGAVIYTVLATGGALLLMPRFLARLPPDYLHNGAHSPMSLGWRVLRNVMGGTLVLVGIFMLLAPGPGILTLLAGLILVDFPGKHAVVVKLLSRPKVLAAVNKLRVHRGARPLEA
jgi:hypothetical protein